MYETFFGFAERPFDLTPNPRYLVLTPSHREALSNLQYGISSRKGITLLTGDAGSGKTTLLRTAIEQQTSQVHCVYLHNPTLTRTEFAHMLASRFGLSDEAKRSKASMLIELEALLTDRHSRGEATILVVDEAQSLPLELLEEIRLLANIETSDDKLLCVVIAGQPELAARLEDPEIRQLKQRVALRCELRSLTQSETAAYVAGRIRAAGGVGAQVFTREAVGVIHDHARGIPRTISVIADNALLNGFATGQRPVGSALVREVCRDFRIEPEHAAGTDRLGTGPQTVDPSPVRKPESATTVGRLLGIERTDDQPDAKGVADTDAGRTEREEMFGGLPPKRRRFLFFGSR